jgi:uncharacterized protein YkwD
MRATFAIAALAGAAIAAPSYGNGYGSKPVENVHVVVETVVKTVYVTEGYEVPTPTPAYVAPAAPTTTTTVAKPAKPTDAYPVVSMPAYEAPAPAQPTYAPAPEPTYAPEPTPEPTPEQPAPPATGGYMDVVSKWRSKMGMKELAVSSKLEGTSKDTVDSSPGRMKHKLNSGVYGQVLAEGTADNFEHVFLGGWLCERANLPGLGNACETASDGWNYQGQTGHADILTSPEYTQIGCSFATGIWCCDLAY